VNKKITPQEAKVIGQYILKATGIELDESKTYLLETRLGQLLEKFGLKNYEELAKKAASDFSGKIKNSIIDAISTNETSFFRDSRPFNLLMHKLIPEHYEQEGERRKLDIWSAASSTGQEAYSIAILIKELMGDLEKYSIKILGTDISDAAVGYASMGRYSKLELSRGLSEARIRKYFTPHDKLWQISDELRYIAQFKKINLMEPLNGVGSFDIILCRNVAIYFSLENRRILFERLGNKLKAGGVLIIGSTESMLGVTDKFTKHEFHETAYYSPK